jgi:hypothetical protein
LVAVAILSRLDRLEDEIEMFKRSGPSPSDYAQVEIVRVAIVAAREIVLSTLTASGTVRH